LTDVGEFGISWSEFRDATIINFIEIQHVILEMKHGLCAGKDW
jgi:hypothetical protein